MLARIPPISASNLAAFRRLALSCLLVTTAHGASATIAQQAVRVQGSATFNERLVEPNEAAIESIAKVKLDVISSMSLWGLMALLEGRADIAMISGDLPGEIATVKELAPKFPVNDFRATEIGRVRAAFAVHPGNAVRRLSDADMRRVLMGEVVNWKELGGADRPIRIVAVREGDGTVLAVRHFLLDGAKLSGRDMIRLESPRQVLKVIAQEPGALGISYETLLQGSGLNAIEIDRVIEQPLSFVTLGPPSAAAIAVIAATKRFASAAPM